MKSDTSQSLSATAVAHPNIALIKYWGKQHAVVGNEPAVSSLSLTLDTLRSQTQVSFDAALEADQLILNGEDDTKRLPRISAALNKLREIADVNYACRVESDNNFPTAAGLASSASGFAALVEACNHALGMQLDAKSKSMLARAMSGSAARSIFGGFAKIRVKDVNEPAPPFGHAYAEPVAAAEHWPLEVCVGIISEQEKAIGSTEGMERSRLTSPYYSAWIEGNDVDVTEAEHAVLTRDFDKLAELSELSCLKMHALALASNPGLIYWQGVTVDALHLIRDLRRAGTAAFFTVDAGPQIKAVCLPGHGERVTEALGNLPGIKQVMRCGLGEGARIIA